jgi:L-lactate dehydrogenase complex protein LldG
VTSKEAILERIGRASVTVANFEREPVVPSVRPREAILDQFADYAAEYRAGMYRIAHREIAEKIEELKPLGPTVVPGDLPEAWISRLTKIRRDHGFSIEEVDHSPSVITGCAVAVAETGSIVLDAGFAQGPRKLSLIPDHHIVVVFESQVVDSVPEAVQRLSAGIMMGRPLTWISGPSATSDIELSRVEGVHGPRRLDILLVKD